MKAKNKAKFNVFAMLGWLLWKLLALFGSRFAKKKLEERRRAQQVDTNPIKRGLSNLTGRTRR